MLVSSRAIALFLARNPFLLVGRPQECRCGAKNSRTFPIMPGHGDLSKMTDSRHSSDSAAPFPEIPQTRAVITWTVAALCVIFTALYHMGRYIAGTPLE